MIFSLFIIPLLKTMSGLLSLFMAASLKSSKDKKRYETVLKHLVEECDAHARMRQQYGDPVAWMDVYKPRTVWFKNEILINAHRPLYILFCIAILVQPTYPAILMFILLSFSLFLIEQEIENIKSKGWYVFLLIFVWAISYPILIYSEFVSKGINFLTYFNQ